MTCRTCQHFVSSERANQRAVLDGFGYCNAADCALLRARFFRDDSACWLIPSRYQERRP